MAQVVTPYTGLELLNTAVLMLDEGLNVTYANPAAETLFAQARKQMVGAPFDTALPGNEEFVHRLAHALEAQAGFNDNDLLLEGQADHLLSPL